MAAQTWPVTLYTTDEIPAPILVSVPPSDRLTIAVTHADGSVTRWAADEPAAENAPGQLVFTSSIPGGHKDCTFTLPRSLDPARYHDEALFDDVQVLGPGGTVVWQGRVTQLPRAQDDTASLSVQCVGYAASMLDYQGFREIYRDADLSGWRTTISNTRRAANAATYTIRDAESRADDTTPALATLLQSPWVTQGESSAWYDAKGIPLGALAYFWQRNNLDHTDTNWQWLAYLLNGDDALTSSDNTGNLRAAGPGYGYLTATAATRDWAAVLLYHAASYSTDTEREHAIDWTGLYVYGNHGLARRGAEPDAGFYASDIIADVIARCCPMAQSTDIDATSYIIPHVVFTEPTTAEDVVSRVNAFHQWRWGWWGKSFWFKGRASDVVWEACLSDGAAPSFEGDDASQVINGVVVTFTDGYGASRVAGPTGYATADTTSDSLLDESEGNPCNRAGVTRWARLALSTPTNEEGAVQIGAAYLTERNLPSRRGTITLSGWVRHPTAGLLPVSRVRAGDWIKITDLEGDVEREIISASYNHEARTVTCEVGGQVARLDAILERLGAEVGLL